MLPARPPVLTPGAKATDRGGFDIGVRLPPCVGLSTPYPLPSAAQNSRQGMLAMQKDPWTERQRVQLCKRVLTRVSGVDRRVSKLKRKKTLLGES